MKITMIAATAFFPGVAYEVTGWNPDPDANMQGAEALAEFAGRACYQSWNRPNPKTAKNRWYLRNILRKKHFSVLEHGSVTFYVTGISRVMNYEMLRHRLISKSELSQRYLDMLNALGILPTIVGDGDDTELRSMFASVMSYTTRVYADVADRLTLQGYKHKRIRETARRVLPGMTETRVVMTGNHRAWREVIAQRATEEADLEIRAFAVGVAWQLKAAFPNLYQDMHLEKGSDGYDIVVFSEGDPDGEALDTAAIPV